jgi:MoaA/NifB/PqqE/SkfB family radical SAM enzyme
MNSLVEFLLLVSKHRAFSWGIVRGDHYRADAYNSRFINIILTDRCNLACSGCRGDISDVQSYELPTLSYHEFVKVVDDCIDAGVEYFDLTPVIGETLLVKNIITYLDYLENHPSVKGYLLTTNGTVNAIPQHHKKLNLSVSLYGSGADSFKRFAGKDLFAKCFPTLESLQSLEVPIEITLRNEDLHDIDTSFKRVLYNLFTKKNVCVHDGRVNDNRGGIVDVAVKEVTRSGVCPCGVGSGGAIRSDGNYYYCAFNDFGKVSLIGDLKKSSLKQLRDTGAWKGIVNDHVNSNYTGICKGCTAQW